MKKALIVMALLVLALSLTACGGSSGDSDSSTSTSTPTTVVEGAVSSAPVKGAEVYATYESLTAEAKVSVAAGTDLLVGKTDKNGRFAFKEGTETQLDRTKNVFMYSKGGMKFTSDYDSVEAADNQGGVSTTQYFNGEMRAVLAPGATEVYLSPSNTLVNDLVAGGLQLEKAQDLVRKVILRDMSIITMKDPLADPLDDLVGSEYIFQAILLAMNTTEEELAKNSDDYKNKLQTAVNKMANSGGLPSMAAATFAAVKTAMAPVLGEKYKSDVDALMENQALTDEAYTVNLTETVTISGDIAAYKSDDAGDYFIKHGTSAVTMSFNITPSSNDTATAGKFVVSQLPDIGKVTDSSEPVVIGAIYSGSKTFSYDLTAAQRNEMSGKIAQFKFSPINGAYVSPVEFTVKCVVENELGVTNVERTKDNDQTSHVISDLFLAVPTDSASFVLAEPSKIKMTNGIGSARIISTNLQKILTLTIASVGRFEVGESAVFEVKAPENFRFEYTATGAADASFKATHAISGGDLVVTFKATTAASFADLVPNGKLLADADKEKIELVSTGTDFDVKMSLLEVTMKKDGVFLAALENDSFDVGNDENIKFYMIASGTKDMILALSIPERQLATVSSTITKNITATLETWETRAGGTMSYVAADWKAKVVTPADSTTTGFGTADPYASSYAFSETTLGGTISNVTGGKNEMVIAMSSMPFTLGDDAPENANSKKYAEIKFVHTDSDIDSYVKDTVVFTAIAQ